MLGKLSIQFSVCVKGAKINKLKKKLGLTNSLSIVYCHCETFLIDWKGYVVVMDNFFSNIKLFTALKDLSIGAVGTAKLRLRFLIELLEISELSIKKMIRG